MIRSVVVQQQRRGRGAQGPGGEVTPPFLWTPARVMFFSYLGLIVAGAAGLMLPSSSRGEALGPIDAVFMATSALCVTGLTVVDTAGHFTRQGQWIILGLMQVGGLGILSFTTWILMLTGQGFGGRERGVAVSSYGSLEGLCWSSVLRQVLIFTLLFEIAGAVLLHGRLGTRYDAGEAWFQSVFHSISAFCNAGFSTIPGGLVDFKTDGLVNAVVMVLIVIGGLGFLVLSDVARGSWARVRGRRGRLSLHTRVVLRMTTLLIGGGTLALLVLDWNHALGPLTLPTRVLAALFQSVTARTAGFNTIDIPSLTSASLFIIMLLMFIGASPGSCGGGVKTTTIAIVLALGRSQAYGRPSVELMERRIPTSDVARALATLAMYSSTFLVGATLLLFLQGWGQPVGATQEGFAAIVFECLSALGTVGLSMDYTSHLTPISRLVVTVLMFCGRLGPIAVALTFVGRARGGHYEYPEESVLTG